MNIDLEFYDPYTNDDNEESYGYGNIDSVDDSKDSTYQPLPKPKPWKYMPKHMTIVESEKAVLVTYKRNKKNVRKWIPLSCLSKQRNRVKTFIDLDDVL